MRVGAIGSAPIGVATGGRCLAIADPTPYDAVMILAGDVGGTKTHLALFEPGGDPRMPVRDRRMPSRGQNSLDTLIAEFLGGSEARLSRAAFGIAGPVVENRTEATNLPWTIDGAALGRTLDADVTLLNDLEATAWGVSHLGDSELEWIHAGRRHPGNRALVAAGTGLGEAIMMWDGRQWRPSASEGGHADFGPRDAIEDELCAWLRARYGRVSYERVLSGPGLADLYRFMSETQRGAEPPAFAVRFAAADDPAAEVTAAALDGSCERAALTLARFASAYGAEAGNLALKAFAVGGVYLGGGIAPRILPMLRGEDFARAFCDKGRLAPLMADIPVAVILDDRAALWGAAAVALG